MLYLICTQALAQTREVTGVVSDKSDGSPIAGVNVVVKGTTTGTATGADGKFTLQVPSSALTLTASIIGFETQEVTIPSSNYVAISLESSSSELQEVVISVGRGSQRTLTDTPLPIDNLTADQLLTTGQPTFDKALQYRVPSFNTVQTPVNDATSLLDPYEIRNMGPSRTLILINGKRKNTSALVYTQTSPGRGETGADISAIPTDAIERVEILRDGASAQYGSDAIAGVMNIILKDEAAKGSITARTGVTAEGDGGMLGISLNNGTSLFGKGFLNYTIDFSKVGLANRPGTVNARGELMDFGGADPGDYKSYLDDNDLLNGNNLTGLTRAQIDAIFATYMTTPAYTAANTAIIQGNNTLLADINSFLAKKPDAGNVNGSPETTASKFSVNGGAPLNENTDFYFNAAYVYKKVNSFANYRTPYWRTLSDYAYLADFFGNGTPGSYVGYVPTFDGDLSDYNATAGFKSTKNDWITDVSFTTGGNTQLWSVRNTHNRNTVGVRDSLGNLKYLENSPLNFNAGGVRFHHNVGNIDVMRSLSEKISLGLGAEFRSENFEVIEGDVASYEGGGADSFAGNSDVNSFKSNRYNIGGYIDLGFDLTENFLINATGRIEDYSDFGEAFVWKVSSRYKFLDDKITIRASASTGFRAPSLHQIFTQKDQYSFVPGQGIQVQGLVNNVSPAAKFIGVPKLDAEKSTNLTIGTGIRPNNNVSFTVDYYDIKVEDRIVLGNNIVKTGTASNPLDQILTASNIRSVSFFVNGLDTRTTGIDVVASYRNLKLSEGTLSFNVAGNYTIKNEREGDIKNPAIIENAGQDVVNFTQEALMFTSRPQFKFIVGAEYQLKKFVFSLNNTLFGPTKFRNDGIDSNLQVEFETKLVTDLAFQYNLSEKVILSLNINNLLNVLPEWKFKALNNDGEALLNSQEVNYAGLTPSQVQSNLATFNQRYSQMTYDGYHFSQLGTMMNFAVNLRL